jgi:2-C-methyl-D-erythritol 2,4-cyclodiphosphate synthase
LKSAEQSASPFRIGFGYDAHRLAKGRKLVLGGVDIPSDRGLVGHSDADVLLHAICDALLGAAALGDIGMHFPNSDPSLRDISSIVLLTRVVALLNDRGYRPVNVDATVVLEQPMIGGHTASMRRTIAGTLALPEHAVSVKATTNEGLGAVGGGEGAVAHAVALVQRTSSPKPGQD